MEIKKLTDAELLVLGLVAEMPRHGYQLEQVIDQRGMREWTRIGFSSIYFVLGKLEKMTLVSTKKPKGPKAKKTFSVTDYGRDILIFQSLQALTIVQPTYSSVLLGMAHWPALDRDQALAALVTRARTLQAELSRIKAVQSERQSLPDFVEALFDYSANQLSAEAEWVARTLKLMNNPRIE